jgi:hypothetical protein
MAAPGTCATCGRSLEDRRRRYCSTVCKDRARRERSEAVRAESSPVAESQVPESPVPESPVPESPVPESPVPESPVPESQVPESERRSRKGGLVALIVVLAVSGIYLLKRRR